MKLAIPVSLSPNPLTQVGERDTVSLHELYVSLLKRHLKPHTDYPRIFQEGIHIGIDDVLQRWLQREPRPDLCAIGCFHVGLAAIRIIEKPVFAAGMVLGNCYTGDVIVASGAQAVVTQSQTSGPIRLMNVPARRTKTDNAG